MRKSEQFKEDEMTGNNKAHDDEVEIIHRVNHLKKKVVKEGKTARGEGFIDPDSIERAQAVIENSQEDYLQEVENIFSDLSRAWGKARQGDSKAIHSVQVYANRIMDLAATYGFDLMKSFSQSLRDFSERIDVANTNHVIIGQAHLDVMQITVREQIKEEDAPKAEELKAVLDQAIRKYG